jgi:hypothetical protein
VFCEDFHPLCEKMSSICNEKPKKHHHDHSKHGSDEWCDESSSSEEYCQECTDLIKANLEFVKTICPWTCNACSLTQNNTIPFAAAAELTFALKALKR